MRGARRQEWNESELKRNSFLAFPDPGGRDLKRNAEPGGEIPWCRLAAFYTPRMQFVGIGYDIHPLVEGRRLILGGVDIPHSKGLEGHSDADALLHAITDAVLGAIGESDIGHFFPNTDLRWKGAPSHIFLKEAARQVGLRKGRIVNIDATLLAQEPKISPHIAKMKQHIADAAGISPNRVGVKATTNEGLGFIGREEGIAAMAVVSVDLPESAIG